MRRSASEWSTGKRCGKSTKKRSGDANKGGRDKHRDEFNDLIDRHQHKLFIDLLREIERRFEIKQANYAFRMIELPYLQTEGAPRIRQLWSWLWPWHQAWTCSIRLRCPHILTTCLRWKA